MTSSGTAPAAGRSSPDDAIEAIDEAVERCAALFRADLRAPVTRRAVEVVTDTVAVAVAGARTPTMTALRAGDDQLGSCASRGSATVWAPGAGKVAAEDAAYLNGTAGGFLELDEGVRPTGHPGMHVVPAALAAAEVAHRSGRDFLAATVAGYELAARAFSTFRLRPPVHPHGHLAGLGAALATALLLDEDPLSVVTVAATTPVVPVWNACYEGATARNTAMGLAASGALRAVRLHRAGFRGSRDSTNALFGSVTGCVASGALRATVDPTRPAIMRNYFKRHSACALTHGAIDAVLALPPIPVDDIRAVTVETVSNNVKLDRQPAPDDLSARFSLPFATAAALRSAAAGAAAPLAPCAFDWSPETARLAERVHVVAAPDLERSWPEHAPARVTVRTAGSEVTATVTDPRGHHYDPLTAAELRAKAETLLGEHGPALVERCHALPATPDCAELLAPLREG